MSPDLRPVGLVLRREPHAACPDHHAVGLLLRPRRAATPAGGARVPTILRSGYC